MELEFLFLYQPRQGDKHSSWLVNKATRSHLEVKVLSVGAGAREIGKSMCRGEIYCLWPHPSGGPLPSPSAEVSEESFM